MWRRLAVVLTFTACAAATPSIQHSKRDHIVSQRSLSKRQYEETYNLTIFHINDVHAHLDQFVKAGSDCVDATKGCFGGYARVQEMVQSIRPNQEHSLLLNAGDEFQGTLFFSFYGGEKIAETINQLGFDVFVPGNHEFDRGDDYLAEFIANLTFPAICANIKTNNTALSASFAPYHIFSEHDLAVIGITTDTIPSISNSGPGTTFMDPVETVQAVIDEIYATTDVKRIIAVTHIGYEKDIEMAKATKGLYMIVGGHSHTLLGDMADAFGPYPTIATNLDGEDVFVVTSFKWGEYLGLIDIVFDAAGKVVEYTGAPIHLDNTTSQDPALQAEVEEWRAPFEAYASQVVGFSVGDLDQTTCQRQECTLGDLMADAAYTYRVNISAGAVGAIINSGGIRASIDAGNVTIGNVLTSFPFGNSVADVSFTGADVWKIFEGVVSGVSQFNGAALTSFVQVSSQIRITYNPANAVGSRLIGLTIGGKNVTSEDATTVYPLVTWDFVAAGGDNIMPVQSVEATLDTQDEALIQYLQAVGTVNVTLDGRIATSSILSVQDVEYETAVTMIQ